MSGFDPEYAAMSAGMNLGVPVRLFRGGRRVFEWFPATLPKDPMELYRGEILAVKAHVGYFVTPLFHYYGVLNTEGGAMVFGPTSQVMANERGLRELAFRLDVKKEDVPAFISGMNGITRLPVETLLSMLCMLNYFLNGGEKLTLSDVAIESGEQLSIKTNVERQRTEQTYGAEALGSAHNTLAIEEALMDAVRKGDTAALKSRLASVPAVRGGTIAPDQLRQLKNTFIVSATLASRAAIRGGVPEDEAFTLSDGYIRRAELLSDQSKLMNLQYNMILEFTEQVEKLNRGRLPSKLASQAAGYVRRDLSEPISAERMAEEFFISRPYLSAKFKRETGMTLTDFILREKTEEAKRLLRYSDKSAAAIGEYLGFSSHSHFIRVFKKYEGVTPNEYREKRR